VNERPPREPFDLIRASFWLVAGIMAVYALDLLIGLLVCGYINATHGPGTCSGEKLGELLATLLATAVAFAGGLMRGDKK
jgi:hypothetical protein